MPSASFAFDASLEAVIFDCDGVILESMGIKREAFRDLFADRSDKLGDILALHVRHAGVDRMTKFEMIYRDILREPLSAANKQALAARFERLVEEGVSQCPMVAGAAELITTLQGRVPMAVVSATPQAELDRILARRKLARNFRAVRGSPPAKTALVGALLAAEGWRAQRVLMVGDAAADFAAARDNGVAFIGRLPPGEPDPFPLSTVTVRDLVPLAEAAATSFSTPQRHQQTGMR